MQSLKFLSRLKTVGERIRAVREAIGLEQSELADRCGWPRRNSRIGNYENNRREPTFEDLIKIARELGVSPAILAFGVEAISSASVQVPLVSWKDMASRKRGKRFVEVIWPTQVSSQAFCVRIPSDQWNGYRKDDHLLIDPAVAPRVGDHVVATTANGFCIARVVAPNVFMNLDDSLEAEEKRIDPKRFVGTVLSSIVHRRPNG